MLTSHNTGGFAATSALSKRVSGPSGLSVDGQLPI
jgi:hypothetical protein